MKKMFFMAIFAGINYSAAIAQNDIASNNRKEKKELKKEARVETGVNINHTTLAHFESDFPGATDVTWQRKQFDEARFYDGKKMVTAYYDNWANLIGTTSQARFSDLPEKAKNYIQKKYAGYSVEAVIVFDDNEQNDTDMIYYGTAFEDADNYFVGVKKDGKETILKVDMNGGVEFFKKI